MELTGTVRTIRLFGNLAIVSVETLVAVHINELDEQSLAVWNGLAPEETVHVSGAAFVNKSGQHGISASSLSKPI